MAQKYYWSTFSHDVNAYMKSYDISLASKAVSHQPSGVLESFRILTHQWKDFLIDFVTGLPISIDWKEDNYNSILVIINWLTKMVYYKPVKIILDTIKLAESIIDMVVRHYRILDSIVTNWSSLFTSKFQSSLCYFLGIKRRLFTTFYPQTDFQTKRQNSTIEAYLWAFVNYKQNNWARLLLMAKFA